MPREANSKPDIASHYTTGACFKCIVESAVLFGCVPGRVKEAFDDEVGAYVQVRRDCVLTKRTASALICITGN